MPLSLRVFCRAGRLAAALAVLCSTGPAAADHVSGLRSEKLVEHRHRIALKMFRTHAELTVRRTVHNGGRRHDQATFHIDLPAGAVATGLRTLGTLAGRPHWFQGELMEAEAAAAKYRELTGIGGYYPKDPALLSWRSQQMLALQVFPCAPAQDKTVEYTLELPARYEGGAFHVELPPLGTLDLPAELEIRAADARDRLLVDGAALPRPRVDPARWLEPLDVALVPHAAPLVGGALVTVPFAAERVLTRYAVHAAPRLSSVPRGAHLVLALDTSLSTPVSFVDQAKAALDAYLSHFDGTGAKVEILTFDRDVAARIGGFADVFAARRELASLQLPRRNGSNVDQALARADALLKTAPAGAERRIVLVTDGLTRRELTPERLRAALSQSGAVTHVGLLDGGVPRLERLDEHPWARGLRASQGLVWSAAADPTQRQQLAAVFEEWARPLRIDHLSVHSPELGLQPELEALPRSLAEGEGFEALGIQGGAVPFIAVEGELWTTPVQVRVAPDPSQERLWSALVFGSELLGELDESEMMVLARRGGAVSPVTSYLAIEPGVRPSTEGLEEGAGGFGEGIGLGSIGALGRGYGRHAQSIDREEFLRERLRDAWQRCGGRPHGARVSFEATLAEIADVDVDVQVDRTPLLERCLTDAVWALVLPVQFTEDWKLWTVDV